METDPERKYHVLDLAAASGNHIEFFSRFRCRYHIGDVLQVFSYLEPPAPEEPAPDFNLILPLHMQEKLDLVLAWDGLNYLDQALLPAFAEHLQRQCRPGAWLHAFVYTRGEMPAKPVCFDILDRGAMRRALGEGRVTAPCYAQRVLEASLPGFRSLQSRLLKNGIQEYLFQMM